MRPGIGLAAMQVGVAERILVIDLQRPEDPDAPEPENDEDDKKIKWVRDPKVFINPEITWESDDLSVYNEGCLSVPEMYADVDRPATIRATWLDENGVRARSGNRRPARHLPAARDGPSRMACCSSITCRS